MVCPVHFSPAQSSNELRTAETGLGGHMRQDQRYLWTLMVTGSVLLTGCAAISKGRADLDVGMKERGIASWYGDDFHGWVTASGERYDMQAFTAAHRTL